MWISHPSHHWRENNQMQQTEVILNYKKYEKQHLEKNLGL